MQSFKIGQAVSVCAALAALMSFSSQVAFAAPDGKALFQQKCALCHANTSLEGFGKSGPNLLGVVGRRAGSVLGFDYTDALKASGLVWTSQTLNTFLTDPPNMVKGTVMPIALPDLQERQAVIQYLQTLR